MQRCAICGKALSDRPKSLIQHVRDKHGITLDEYPAESASAAPRCDSPGCTRPAIGGSRYCSPSCADGMSEDPSGVEPEEPEIPVTHRTCEICGEEVLGSGSDLARHLWKKHGITSDDYRVRYLGEAPREVVTPSAPVRDVPVRDSDAWRREVKREYKARAAAESEVRALEYRSQMAALEQSAREEQKARAGIGRAGCLLTLAAGVAGYLLAPEVGVSAWLAAAGGILAGAAVSGILSAYLRALGGGPVGRVYADSDTPWIPDLDRLPPVLRVPLLGLGVVLLIGGGYFAGHWAVNEWGWSLPFAIVGGFLAGGVALFVHVVVVGWAACVLLWLFDPRGGLALLLPLGLGTAGFFLADRLDSPSWLAAGVGVVAGGLVTVLLVALARAARRSREPSGWDPGDEIGTARSDEARYVSTVFDETDAGQLACTVCGRRLEPLVVDAHTKVLQTIEGTPIPLECRDCGAIVCSECVAPSGILSLPTDCPRCGGSVNVQGR